MSFAFGTHEAVRTHDGVDCSTVDPEFSMLVFGETWGKVFGTLSDAEFYEWFYAVFTPFSDFSFSLPKLRLVGLAFGEDEEVASWPSSWGQGATHLGRAEEAVTPDQVVLVETGLSPSKKTVFTDGGQQIGDGGAKITAAHDVKSRLASLAPSAPLTSWACP